MKPTRDTAYLTIGASVISILVLLLIYAMQIIAFNVPDSIRPLFSFIPVLCFAWLMIFVIGILKYTNEKSFIVNAFIAYTIYSAVTGLFNTAIGVFHVNPQSLMLFYQVNGTISLLVIISLVIMTFLLRPTEFRLPLQLFALSELFIMMSYLLVPILLPLFGVSSYIILHPLYRACIFDCTYYRHLHSGNRFKCY
ncbi:hypothetical protein [Mucilaginibacter endophyticus]|uniref:hypothetical protein n=1 Tax=Mucilaginibacter endophyticus TaxID=2675003 RepID=UPI0012B16DE6|nr:hypothetical protein [Mucilaginibacter endophyticus]